MGLSITDHKNPPFNFSTELQDVDYVREFRGVVTAGPTLVPVFATPALKTGEFLLFRLLGIAATDADQIGAVRRTSFVVTGTGSPSRSSGYQQLSIVESPTSTVEWLESVAGTGAAGDAVVTDVIRTSGATAIGLFSIDYMVIRETDV